MEALRAQLRAIIQREMQQDPAHDIAHLDRVWANAHRIAKSEHGVNLRVLLGATYFHDLVNLPKDAHNRAEASRMSAEKAAPFLTDLGFTPDEIKAAQHAIAAHSYSAGIPPESFEAEILRDADRLDALGAVGIARTFMVAGTMGRPLLDPNDPFAADRDLDDQLWSIDHWHLKLLQLPHEMVTEKGRKIARKRARLMLAYLKQLAKEMDTDLPDHWAKLLQ
ncbi:HD domain-containing protein [Cognatishimia activa]|uniref:Hydrolase n=1 Tax=Cognatishimia activa TaxID=1715691 RepID=A0A975I880_9RHOB|nr:HD domain-containing protein [Cognatishimia activa]QTN36988.1 hydrolase [Cognatishimia activa]